VDKIDALLVAIQKQLTRHDWDYFPVEISPGGPKVTVPGCSTSREQCNTTTQCIEHLADDALPALFASLRARKDGGS
jgi:hypothetical protein